MVVQVDFEGSVSWESEDGAETIFHTGDGWVIVIGSSVGDVTAAVSQGFAVDWFRVHGWHDDAVAFSS